ncbi:MAG: hypothetical protein OQK75_02855 [Gammaproteobacteria bacterium]|nr:hypothetical protein [Gammaproteobacteria bacterium]MCW8986588.1 hypothetical protein [Gammaproteobacteria bacterium]MCW9032498.1 hypothetical protein [Gammaproteobacteria bacterium]
MQGISDIKIIGVDETRPPVIRKEPYIDIFFQLSHEAPIQWCKDFNTILATLSSSATIEEKKGLFINTWVRTTDEIAPLLEELKKSIIECTQQYIERIARENQLVINHDAAAAADTSAQGQLNRIIASLNFKDDNE